MTRIRQGDADLGRSLAIEATNKCTRLALPRVKNWRFLGAVIAIYKVVAASLLQVQRNYGVPRPSRSRRASCERGVDVGLQRTVAVAVPLPLPTAITIALCSSIRTERPFCRRASEHVSGPIDLTSECLNRSIIKSSALRHTWNRFFIGQSLSIRPNEAR